MKTALVTGPSSGIGKALTHALAAMGYHVVAAGRSAERVKAVVDAVVDHGGSAEYLPLDLTSLGSAREAAQTMCASGRNLDLVINNAGIGMAHGTSADGFEIHFAVNHLGHFMLTLHLAPTFRPGTRIVSISSAVHHRVRSFDPENWRGGTRSMFGLPEYAASKLGNVLFVTELARRHPELATYAVHPGFVDTNLIPRWARPFVKSRLITPDEGADTALWCGTSAEVEGQSGLYYQRREIATPSALAADPELAIRLWEQSERWCAVDRPT